MPDAGTTTETKTKPTPALKLNFLEKLALHTEHPRLFLPMTGDVPVNFGDNPMARQAALTALSIIDMGLQGRQVAQKNIPGLESPWVHDLQAQAGSDLFVVESSYQLKRDKELYPVTLDQLGFRLSSGLILTTAEAKAPWEYDPEFEDKIKTGDAKLEKNGFEMQLRPSGQPDGSYPLSLTRKDFSIEVRGSSEKDSLIVPSTADGKTDYTKVKMRNRATPNVLAVIVPHGPSSGGFAPAPADVAGRDAWEKVAVFRTVTDATSSKISIEVVLLAAQRDGQSIHLSQPVDPSFYGSPILVPEGVLGLLQDEQTGAFLPADVVTGGPAAGGQQ